MTTTRVTQSMPRVVIVQTHSCKCAREVFNHPAANVCSGGVTIDFQFELWADANAFALLIEAGILNPIEEAGR